MGRKYKHHTPLRVRYVETEQPIRVPDELREAVARFEGMSEICQ